MYYANRWKWPECRKSFRQRGNKSRFRIYVRACVCVLCVRVCTRRWKNATRATLFSGTKQSSARRTLPGARFLVLLILSFFFFSVRYTMRRCLPRDHCKSRCIILQTQTLHVIWPKLFSHISYGFRSFRHLTLSLPIVFFKGTIFLLPLH